MGKTKFTGIPFREILPFNITCLFYNTPNHYRAIKHIKMREERNVRNLSRLCTDMRRSTTGVRYKKCVVLCADMRRLMTGIRYEKCVVLCTDMRPLTLWRRNFLLNFSTPCI